MWIVDFNKGNILFVYLLHCRYIGRNQQMEVLNLCMCQGITENALVPLCNSLHRYCTSSQQLMA